MEILETESNVVVLNTQPEFTAKTKEKCSADYFILCEEDAQLDLQSVTVAGVSVINWVARACDRRPKILTCKKSENVLDVIKPYISDADFSVVLYANTPLITKGHLKDLLGFVMTKRMNACKLKKGFVLKNDYIANVDEVYSVDCYDFASNDLFEVTSVENLAVAEEQLVRRILNYHVKNGVEFESACNIMVDASVEIGSGTRLANGACIYGNTSIGSNVKIGENVTIKNSKIGDDVVVGDNISIIGSVIKNGTIIAENVVVDSSAIMNNVKIGKCAKILSSKIKDNVHVSELAEIFNSRIAENVSVGVSAKIIGENMPALVMQNAEIGALSVIIDASIDAGNVIRSGETRRGGM